MSKPKETFERFDHNDPELGADPFPTYARMRAQCPVARSEAHGGFWAVTAYDDVFAALRDSDTYSSARGVTVPELPSEQSLGRLPPLEFDEPEHGVYRRLTQNMFAPARLARWENRIREICRACIDDFAGEGRADLVLQYAIPVPMTVICEILGLPAEDGPLFRKWSADIVHHARFDEPRRMETMMALGSYIARHIESRRDNPRDDMMTHLVHAQRNGTRLSENEALRYCLLLLIAGNETTTNLMGATLWHLAEEAALLADLVANPDKIPVAAEEFLRFFGPVQGIARTATRDVVLGGCPVRKGDKVLLMIASANRDSEEFSSGDELQVGREPNRHIAFGAGPHRCLGSHLARLEIRIMLEELLQRIPQFRVCDGARRRWLMGVTRGIQELPVTFEPAGPRGRKAARETLEVGTR